MNTGDQRNHYWLKALVFDVLKAIAYVWLAIIAFSVCLFVVVTIAIICWLLGGLFWLLLHS